MKLFRKRIKGNNKGLSLVELVCAVAIFGVAATAIGSAMVVSAQSYSRGTYELDVQEEAQTATNIVGNLIFDAVEATHVGNTVEIKGEGITYRITHDTGTQTLNYTEVDSAGNSANGILAENVTSFGTSLTADPNDFKADRNVKVEITIEKSGRTYAASYNTTARNGSANAIGAAESATISVDSVMVIEPGQTSLELPVTVTGSIVNKNITVSDPDVADPVSVSPGTNCVYVTASATAQGTYSFIVNTQEKKEDGITPLDSKTVTVKVRRIDTMSGIKEITSTEGEGDLNSTYKLTFSYTGDSTAWNKVYGREYDNNYVDPRQFSFSYTDASGNDVKNEYFDAIVEQTGENPSVTFKLKKALPMGSKLYVTCTALHSTGTNKTGTVYGPVSYPIPIVKSPFSNNGKIARGNDGNIKISVDSSFMQKLRDDNSGCTINKIMEFYEATMHADGTFTKNSATPVFTYLCTDGGNDTFIRSVDSNRMIPNQAYIMVIRLEVVDASNNVKWPTIDVDPGLYQHDYPISPISIKYRSHGGHSGTASDPYQLTKGTPYNSESICPWFDIVGLDMSKSWRDYLSWKVQKKVGDNWVDSSFDELDYMSGYVNGSGTLKIKCAEEGHYRLLTWMDNAKYRNYADTADVYGDFNFYDVNTGAGIVYIDFK